MAAGAGASVSAMNAEQSHGDIITFYSYKGGTGRSMALANIAYLLSNVRGDGKEVLVIDWDLEAPGLHRYLESFISSAGDDDLGLIDLFEDVDARRIRSTIEDREELARDLVNAIDLERYIRRADSLQLSFIRAGKFDDDYPRRTNTFNWNAFFQAVPDFFRYFAERLAREFRYVLIDSRTGVTDISGICTMLMPHKLVVVFTPNRQSLTGITSLVKRASDYRNTSNDYRPLIIFPLPSRIDLSYPALVQPWREGNRKMGLTGWQNDFETLLTEVFTLDPEETAVLQRYFDDVQIFHVAQYAFGEPMAAVDQRATDKSTVTNSYAHLIEYLRRGAPWQLEETQKNIPPAASAPPPLVEQAPRFQPSVRSRSAERGAVRPRQYSMIDLARWSWRLVTLIAPVAVLIGFLVVTGWYLLHGRAQLASSRLLPELLKADDQKISPRVKALLLAETLPYLRSDDHDVAGAKLKDTLRVMPRNVIRWRPGRAIRDVSFSADGGSLICVTDGAITVWNARTGTKSDQWPARVLQGRFYGERLDEFVTMDSSGLRLWKGHELEAEVPFIDQPAVASLSDAGQYLARDSFRSISLFRVADAVRQGRFGEAWTVPLDGRLRTSVQFPTDGLSVIWEFDGVTILDLQARTRTNITPPRPYTTGAVSNDGSFIGFITNNELVVQRTSAKVTAPTLAPATDFAFSSDMTALLAVSPDGLLRTLTTETGRPISANRFKPIGEVPSVILPLRRGRFALAYANEVVIVPHTLDAPLARIESRQKVTGIFADASSVRLVVVSGQEMTVWDVSRAGEPVRVRSKGELIQMACQRAGLKLTKEEWATYLPNRSYDPQCTQDAAWME